MSYKFILDTNVLKEESVKKLKDAGLIDACNSGRFAFYVTPVLLKERLDFASRGEVYPGAATSVQFLLELKWQRLFNELGGPEGIFTKEVEGKSQSEYLFIDYAQIEKNLGLILNGGEFVEDAKKEILNDKLR